jgi:predicted esterase
MTKLILGLHLALALILSIPARAVPAAGWQAIQIPATHSFFWRYFPAGADTTKPLPVVVFLHGAGANASLYMKFVEGAAEGAGCVVALPNSSGVGWGSDQDALTVSETVRLVREELSVDDRRIAIAGHSAGGAYAYLLAYAGSVYSAVFSLSSPFYPVDSVANSSYKPPIRMYYGTTDPNYVSAYPRLKSQWTRLEIPWEEDVQAGYGHSNWPATSMSEGFRFLVSKSRPGAETSSCLSTATSLCLSRGRFRAEVAWEIKGRSGPGVVVPGASADSGLFWFFSPDNWELMVKVLDGCGNNGHYWVFAAATTDVHYVLTVTDTLTGRVARYENPAGRPSPATTDTSAFATCP